MKQQLRKIPAIHAIQSDERFNHIIKDKQIPLKKVTEWVQQEIYLIRTEMLKGEWNQLLEAEQIKDYILEKIEEYSKNFQEYQLRRVINGTGTILHTNLGRARLSEEAIEQVVRVARNYSNLEYNIEEGQRGSRHDIIETILQEVTGAEAAMVVNNNAAAVYLILRALAQEKEVIVSRGQLVEIGGSFRVSSIMEESGAKLIEVGTTNKTHPYDYERAISEETAMILKVHTSNFKTVGFTESVSTEQLAKLSSKEGLIFYEDLGSGALYDFTSHGIGDEPVVSQVLKKGVDLVSISGDKLLGGPQAGIIVGKRELIQKLKKHQLARVLRVDKMTLAALEATLKAYTHENKGTDIPAIRDILAPVEIVKRRALEFLTLLGNSGWECNVQEDVSQIGGGTMPTEEIPTCTVVVKHQEILAHHLFEELRLGQPCVITRIKDQHLIIDFRTVTDDELPLLVDCFKVIQEKKMS